MNVDDVYAILNSKIEKQDHFSTTEIDTGKKFIDGRAIYSKYYSVNNLIFVADSYGWYPLESDLNIDQLVSCKGGFEFLFSGLKTEFVIPCINTAITLETNSTIYFFYSDYENVTTANLWVYIEYVKPTT